MHRVTEYRRDAEKPGMIGLFKLLIFDVRLLATIVAALIIVAILSDRNLEKELVPFEVAPGGPEVLVTSFALSPTGGQIATTDGDGRVTLRTRENLWHIEGLLDFPGYAHALAFSPDGRSLAVVGEAPGIWLWDLNSRTSQLIGAEVASNQRALNVTFSPDGQTLAVTTDIDGTISLWDLTTRRERMVLHHPSSPVKSIVFSPDGRWLATGGSRYTSILIWDVHSGSRRVLAEGESGNCTAALAFSPDGALLASAGKLEQKFHVRLWDVQTGNVRLMCEGQPRHLNSVAFSPDGSLLAVAGDDGTELWTVPAGRRRVRLDGQAKWRHTVAFSPSGRTLFLSTGNDGIRGWDIAELLGDPRSDPRGN